MTCAPQRRKGRSWLFAPGDSPRKMAKAIASNADIVVFDLEDAVAPQAKAAARAMVADAIAAAHREDPSQLGRIWVRINPIDGDDALADLAAVMPARPGGLMLPKAQGRADTIKLDHCLSVLEVEHGVPTGTTQVIVVVTETASAMFRTGDYKGAPRVMALSWGAEDLADSIGAATNTNSDGSYGFTYELARTMCLLGAASAEIAAIETVQTDFRDLHRLKLRAEQVRDEGFSGMLAIHPAQIDVINAAFTPTPAQVEEARSVVDLFAANPGAGTIGHNGAMLDRPHLSRALRLLARADA